MAENDSKVDDVKIDESKEDRKALAMDQAYRYAEMLKPSLQDGVGKAKEKGSKAKGDMVNALKWFNSMSAAKQKSLVDMATGAATMTKDAVAALTESTTKEYSKMRVFVAEKGLSEAAQATVRSVNGKLQQIYSSASEATNEALAAAKLKQEEVLASESVVAAKAWSEAAKKAVEESKAVTQAKETGGDALKRANESYAAALLYAEQKRLEAIQLSSLYLAAAQEQMVALSETSEGRKLQERTQNLLDLTKKKAAELQEKPAVKNATEQLEQSVKLAAVSVQAAQDWVTAVTKSQQAGKAGGDQILKQIELVEILESGAEDAVLRE